MRSLILFFLFLLLFFSSANSQWVLQNSGTNQRFLTVFFLNQNLGWAGGDEGCIVRTTNGGLDWYDCSIGLKHNVHSIYFIDSLKGWATIYTYNPYKSGYIIATSDGGINWYFQYYSGSNTLHRIQFINENFGWAVGSGGIFLRTISGGNIWQESFISLEWSWSVYFISLNIGWSGDGSSGYLRKTVDGGLTWHHYYTCNYSKIFDIEFINNLVGWAVGENGCILKTDDGGLTWNLQNSGTLQHLRDVDFIDDSTGWAVGFTGVILQTKNGGLNWNTQYCPTSDSLFGLSMFDKDNGWIAGNNGIILFTENGGGGIIPVELASFTASVSENSVTLNWLTATELSNLGFEIQRQNSDDKNQNMEWTKIGFVPGFGTTTEPKSYSFIDSKLETGNYNYRLKQIDLDGSFAYSNTINIKIEQPFVFTLDQNYPNPFNPVTSIQYAIANKQFVKLIVYDVLGNEIAVLVNEEKPAGKYEVSWNASNLASGAYIYRLQSGLFVSSKKIMLLR